MKHYLLLIRREGCADYARIERLEAPSTTAAMHAALSKHWTSDARIMGRKPAGKGRTRIGIRWYDADNRARYDSMLLIATGAPRVAPHDGRALAYNDD